MQLSDLRDRLDEQLTYPIDQSSVVAALGDEPLEAPTGQTETLQAVLDRSDATRFESTDQLYETVLGNVGDEFVGRKFYDDRGHTRDRDSREQSF
jgi:hypothetical protein